MSSEFDKLAQELEKNITEAEQNVEKIRQKVENLVVAVTLEITLHTHVADRVNDIAQD